MTVPQAPVRGAMPQIRTYKSGNLYSHFWSEHAVPDIPGKVSDAADIVVQV